MRPFVLNGNVWRVIRVQPGDPYLVDQTGMPKLAVADPAHKMIGISRSVFPPLLDRILLHEIGHAITMEYGLPVDEESAQLIEGHSVEAVTLASEVLGRPVCVDGLCV